VIIKQKQQQHHVIINERCRDGKKREGESKRAEKKESQTKQTTDHHVFTKK